MNPSFLLWVVDQKRLISVAKNSKGYVPFQLLQLIKNLEMSIKELQKIQEENDKMEEEEKKLAAEEMSKRWGQLAMEVNLLGKQRVKSDIIYRHIPQLENVYRNIAHRIAEAKRTISQSEPGRL